MVPFDQHPQRMTRCPKCGESEGWSVFYWSAETDDNGDLSPEHLEWSCRNCSYAISTQPADAPR